MKEISRSAKGEIFSLLESLMAEGKKKKEEPKIDIFKAWCKACGICVAFCPTGVLAKDEAGNPYVKNLDKCIHCGWCEIRCPDFAITVEQKTTRDHQIEERSEEAKPEGSLAPR